VTFTKFFNGVRCQTRQFTPQEGVVRDDIFFEISLSHLIIARGDSLRHVSICRHDVHIALPHERVGYTFFDNRHADAGTSMSAVAPLQQILGSLVETRRNNILDKVGAELALAAISDHEYSCMPLNNSGNELFV